MHMQMCETLGFAQSPATCRVWANYTSCTSGDLAFQMVTMLQWLHIASCTIQKRMAATDLPANSNVTLCRRPLQPCNFETHLDKTMHLSLAKIVYMSSTLIWQPYKLSYEEDQAKEWLDELVQQLVWLINLQHKTGACTPISGRRCTDYS